MAVRAPSTGSSSEAPLNGPKEQKSRMFKAACTADNCPFLVRDSAQQAREIGPPHCPKHGAMIVDLPADERAEINEHQTDKTAPQHRIRPHAAAEALPVI
jgi:hypothetical protein